METISKLSNIQLELLKLFSTNISDSDVLDIKQLIINYYAQKFATAHSLKVKAFTGSGAFKSENGKLIYDGSMIRFIDTKSQKTRLSIFTPNFSPTIIRK